MRKGTVALILTASLLYSGQKPSDLEKYLASIETTAPSVVTADATPGSLYVPSAALTALGLDIRARNLNDLLTVIVQERASAVASGTLQSTRQSDVKSSIGSLYGPASQAWNRLAQLSTASNLDGQGSTSRETVLTTSLTARVVHVLPNGNMVIEGIKNVTINSENQLIVLRGIVRPPDISSNNSISSERIGNLDVRVNGKGVVADAVRRPFFLYRLLLGLLPF